MFNTFLCWIRSLFSINPVGVLVLTIFSKAGRIILKDLLDPITQAKAREFVRELNRDHNISTIEKANKFNKKMLEWLAKEGKKLIDSQINFIREWAVSAVKIEDKSQSLGLSSREL